jgi:hypothetical protein
MCAPFVPPPERFCVAALTTRMSVTSVASAPLDVRPSNRRVPARQTDSS